MTTLIIAALLAASAQDVPPTAEGGVVARQVRIPVAEALSGKVEVSDGEKDELKERRRHNREMEKQLRRIARNNPFALGAGAARQPKEVRRLPPNSSSY